MKGLSIVFLSMDGNVPSTELYESLAGAYSASVIRSEEVLIRVLLRGSIFMTRLICRFHYFLVNLLFSNHGFHRPVNAVLIRTACKRLPQSNSIFCLYLFNIFH